jgi:cytochrome c-type biogenesis protein CcmF
MVGSILLSFALALSLFSMAMYFLNYKGAKNALSYARLSYHGMTMLIIIASALLMYFILTHQYQYKYVYEYSNDDLSLGFLISTFWAGQEGSFLLWLLMTSIIGIFLQSYTAKREDLEPRVMAIFTLAVSFLLFMVSPLLKSPFAYIWAEPTFIDAAKLNTAFFNLPFLQNFMFSDQATGQNLIKLDSNLAAQLNASGILIQDFIIHGKGLNPLLQNFWMQIHPPILFVGFAMTTVPFSFAISSLIKNEYKDWVKQSLPWILAGSGILGLGIMLGGYWAYGVLGWGGYWAWDPVENSSLVPWLISVAAIHTMLVQKRSQIASGGQGRFIKTNLILSILSFVLVLYSTFLTRSGILGDSSVHSFAEPGRLVYLFLIIFVATFLLIGGGLIVRRWKTLNEKVDPEENFLSRELALFTAAIVIGASALIVWFGTSAPIFGMSVQTSFYNKMHVPLAIIIGILNGLSLFLKWKETSGKDLLIQSRFSIIASLLTTIIIVIIGSVYEIMMILMTLSAMFTLFVNFEIALKIIKGNKTMLGAYVAHAGIAIFILGVIGSSAYGNEVNIDLEKGKQVQALGYNLEFANINPIENNSKYEFVINVKKGEKSYQVKPIMFISSFNNGLMREPDILEGITKDFYISPVGYDDGATDQGHQSSVSLNIGEFTEFENARITYTEFIKPDLSVMQTGGDFKMGAKILVELNGKVFNAEALTIRKSEQMQNVPAEIKDANIKIELGNVDPATKKIDLVISHITGQTAVKNPKEVLSITASTKPFVSFVWIGVAVMVLGFVLSTIRRTKESNI